MASIDISKDQLVTSLDMRPQESNPRPWPWLWAWGQGPHAHGASREFNTRLRVHEGQEAHADDVSGEISLGMR